jgi:hypothetical protein
MNKIRHLKVIIDLKLCIVYLKYTIFYIYLFQLIWNTKFYKDHLIIESMSSFGFFNKLDEWL